MTAYRTVKRGNRTFLVAIVPKAGPKGGHTVALAGPAPSQPIATHRAVPLTRQAVKRKVKRARKRSPR